MPEAKRRGRPCKPDAERKRRNITFRLRDDLFAKLGADADANGRSLSEEVEFRLERSFIADEVRAAVAEAMRQRAPVYADFVGPRASSGRLGDQSSLTDVYVNQLGNRQKI